MSRNCFPNSPPGNDLSPEEMTRIARRFRRKALLAEGGLLLGFLAAGVSAVFSVPYLGGAGLLAMAVSAFLGWLLFCRCPCCGRLVPPHEHLTFLIWRGYECPVCNFSPDWNR